MQTSTAPDNLLWDEFTEHCTQQLKTAELIAWISEQRVDSGLLIISRAERDITVNVQSLEGRSNGIKILV